MTAIEQYDAKTVMEIGVASGGSTLYMLAMLGELPGPRRLLAFDLDPTYYADRSKPTGYLALESEFNADGRLEVRTGLCSAEHRSAVADLLGSSLEAIDFAFIDANHRHPWAAIDLLFTIPLMKEGGIVAFHDINLPFYTQADKGYGPMTLFARPFAGRVVMPGDEPNIGLLRVEDKPRMIDLCIATLRQDWEVTLDDRLADISAREIETGPLSARADELVPFFSPIPDPRPEI